MANLSDIDVAKPNVAVDSVPVCDGYTKEIREATVVSFGEEHHLEGPHKILYGDTASRPGHGFLNRIYYNNETEEIERDTGAGWVGLGFWTGKIKLVSYNGDGLSSKNIIIGTGMQPIAVFLIPANSDGSAFIRFISFGGASSHKMSDAVMVNDGIININTDGFTVGIAANGNGVLYSALCLFL